MSDWPQWRGPQRNGIAEGARLPVSWPEQLAKPKWRAPLGIGYSSPVIAGGMVFIQDRETKSGTEFCYGLDDKTGKVAWKFGYPSRFEPPDPTAGKGPNSTPTVDRGQVYMLGLGGMFHCFEARSGRLLWSHDLAQEYWGVEKAEIGDLWFPVCGVATSALAVGDEVIVSVGGKKAGSLAGFDRKTGKLLWKALDDRSSYASPLLGEVGGVSQLVAFTGKRMVGLHPKTHTLLWEYPVTCLYEQTIVTPLIWKDRVLIAHEAKPIVALEPRSGKVAWQSAELSPYLSTPVVVKDHVVGMDARSRRIVCVECASGKVLWSSPNRMGRNFASLVVAGETLLVLSDLGELYVLAADPTVFKLLRTYKVAEPGTIWSQLAVVDNRLYIRDQSGLSCYAL
jgi:outer membrane protein assembly factor BamB